MLLFHPLDKANGIKQCLGSNRLSNRIKNIYVQYPDIFESMFVIRKTFCSLGISFEKYCLVTIKVSETLTHDFI